MDSLLLEKKPALENPLCGAFAIIHGFYTNEQKLSNQIGRSKLCEIFYVVRFAGAGAVYVRANFCPHTGVWTTLKS